MFYQTLRLLCVIHGSSRYSIKMRKLTILGSLVILLFLNGCSTVVLLAAAPGIVERSKNKNVSNQQKYWKSLTKGGVYRINSDVVFVESRSERHYSANLIPIVLRRSSDESDLLRPGVLVRADSVLYRSDGLNFFRYDYIGTVLTGKHKGALVRLNDIFASTKDYKIKVLNQSNLIRQDSVK